MKVTRLFDHVTNKAADEAVLWLDRIEEGSNNRRRFVRWMLKSPLNIQAFLVAGLFIQLLEDSGDPEHVPQEKIIEQAIAIIKRDPRLFEVRFRVPALERERRPLWQRVIHAIVKKTLAR